VTRGQGVDAKAKVTIFVSSSWPRGRVQSSNLAFTQAPFVSVRFIVDLF